MDDDRRTGPGRRENDFLTATDLDDILAQRDHRVRQIIHEELSALLRPLREHLADHRHRLTKTERVLWGEDRLYAGVVSQLATVSLQLSEMTQLLATARTLLRILRIAVPVGGLAVTADIAIRLLGG